MLINSVTMEVSIEALDRQYGEYIVDKGSEGQYKCEQQMWMDNDGEYQQFSVTSNIEGQGGICYLQYRLHEVVFIVGLIGVQ